MRKWMPIFLMLLLPLQWTAALAADCCLRHGAGSEQQAGYDHAQMHSDHHEHHAKVEMKDGANDSTAAKADCNSNCAGCHLHHCAAVVRDARTDIGTPPSARDDTPYLSSVTSPLPDNLFRPPLALLA
jgi:hypothetical protein